MTAMVTLTTFARSREAPPALPWRVVMLVLLPFAGGFYLSYLYRSVNALIADRLTDELGIGAAQLGILTSVYLLVSAAAQLPLGLLLDRFGPRRVQGTLLVLAALGALQFAGATGFWGLFVGRALIGLGVASALMAGIKAAVTWVPKERLALANGILLGLGTLGAVTATVPAEMIIAASGWRTLFAALAAMTLASAASLWLLVPERADRESHRGATTRASLLSIARDHRFLHLAPLAGLCVGTSWALQGLWVSRWLADVDGLERPAITTHLLVLALALSAGAVGLGWAADRLSRRGITLEMLFAAIAACSISAQLALVWSVPLPPALPWSIIAAAGSATVLSYAMLATYVPRQVAARANALLNLFHFGAAFAVQWGFGIGLAQWPAEDGHHPAHAYSGSLAIAVVVQSAALLWFLSGQVTSRVPVFAAASRMPTASGIDYAAAHAVWRSHLADAKQQTRSWRRAAFGSVTVTLCLAVALIQSVVDRPACVHVITVDHIAAAPLRAETRDAIASRSTQARRNSSTPTTHPV